MSNTSLKSINIPKLNTPNFGEAIQKAFQNIDLNFQKLSNLGLNQGAPGLSAVYVPINLGAAFVYAPCESNELGKEALLNKWNSWQNVVNSVLRDTSEWKEIKESVDRDYIQFAKVTNLPRTSYANIASMLLFGDPDPFGFGQKTPERGSIAETIHERYKNVEGVVTLQDGKLLGGNWPYLLYTTKATPEMVNEYKNEALANAHAYANVFKSHFEISVPGKLIVALSPNNNSYVPVCSFEYWYIDPRFRCGQEVASGDIHSNDISCVLRWEADDYEQSVESGKWAGHFNILEIFPTIRLGSDGKYYWFINGLNTGIPIQGAPGRDGKAGQIVVVERVENVKGWDPKLYPNGKQLWGPVRGTQTFQTLQYSGQPSATIDREFTPMLGNNVKLETKNQSNTKVTEGLEQIDEMLVDSVVADADEKHLDKAVTTSHFKYFESDPWLPDSEQIRNLTDFQALYRIFRIVGREKFWAYPGSGSTLEWKNEQTYIDHYQKDNDEYDRQGDPTCDEYFYGQNLEPIVDGETRRGTISQIDPDRNIQNLISELDGSLAIVLPGPAYSHDRTDTTFWFATLRKVRYDVTNPNDRRFMLVAYCSAHAQQTTQLDEHSQAGMMQSFDAYTYKSNSDSRNKPRGLMLPIGSAKAATSTPSDTWAAHIFHSDRGGFVHIPEPEDESVSNTSNDFNGKLHRRGTQPVELNGNKGYKVTLGALSQTNNIIPNGSNEGQYVEIIDKRILHLGSVDDYRALNFVENAPGNTYKDMNGAMPGRRQRGDEGVQIGYASFYGKFGEGHWFQGSEFHIDEPLTITRYRDTLPKGRLLDVEGDTIIGPHRHKNFPDIDYLNGAGGLWVCSTFTHETIDDERMFEHSIFGPKDVNGELDLTFEPFIRNRETLTSGCEIDENKSRWTERIGRWEGKRGFYKDAKGNSKDPNDFAIATQDPQDSPLFSGIFDDAIGARVMVAQDGIAIYNPSANLRNAFSSIGDDGKRQYKKSYVPFSVDAMGNIQTYGREIRSNSDDTAWYFHTKWFDDTDIKWKWETSLSEGGILNSVLKGFEPPRHNELTFASDHELYTWNMSKDTTEKKALSLYWKTANYHEFGAPDGENPQLDPVLCPYGYRHTFGFTNKTGSSCTTFPHTFNHDQQAHTWGAAEYLPTVLSMPVDVQWLWGSLLVSGVNPRAFDIYFDGKETATKARFGGAFKHGIVISEPACGPISARYGDVVNEKGEHVNGLETMHQNNYTHNHLEWSYDGKKYLSDDDGGTRGETNLFGATKKMKVGLWNMWGQIVEKSMIVGEDMLVYRSFAARGQARAKSFRRHVSTWKDSNSPGWAFLLDNGFSSIPAPAAKYEYDNFTVPPKPSPLYIDFGKAFGQNRLVRFGITQGDIEVDDNGRVKKTDAGDINDPITDNSGALIASLATKINISVTKNGYLFNQNTTKKYGITATLTSLFGVCKLDIVLKVDQLLKGNDWNHHSTHVFRENCYGIDTNCAPRLSDRPNNKKVDFTCHIGGTDSTARSRAAQRATQAVPDWKMNETYDGIGPDNIVDCTGFNTLNIFDGYEDYKPGTDLWVPIISMWNGAKSCNWPTGGTDSDRGWGKGLWFKLDTNGKLTIPWYSSAGSIFTRCQTITVSFVWLLSSATNKQLWDLARTRTRIRPSNTTPSTDIKTLLSNQEWPGDNDWKDGSYKYLWYRQTGTTEWHILDYAMDVRYFYAESYESVGSDDDEKIIPTGATQTISGEPGDPISWLDGFTCIFMETSYIDIDNNRVVSTELFATRDDVANPGDDELADDLWDTNNMGSKFSKKPNTATVTEWLSRNHNLTGILAGAPTEVTRVSGTWSDSIIVPISGSEAANIYVDVWTKAGRPGTNEINPLIKAYPMKIQFSFKVKFDGTGVTDVMYYDD